MGFRVGLKAEVGVEAEVEVEVEVQNSRWNAWSLWKKKVASVVVASMGGWVLDRVNGV